MGKVEVHHCAAHHLSNPAGAFKAGVGQDHGKFFSAKARDHVDGAAGNAIHFSGEQCQAHVAALVAERVVERLEVVNIEKDEGERRIGAVEARTLLFECLIEAAPVSQSGKGIRSGKAGELFIRLLLALILDVSKFLFFHPTVIPGHLGL